jgi:hypothetical protein
MSVVHSWGTQVCTNLSSVLMLYTPSIYMYSRGKVHVGVSICLSASLIISIRQQTHQAQARHATIGRRLWHRHRSKASCIEADPSGHRIETRMEYHVDQP